MNQPGPDPISTVAALDEPTRRRLYDYVVRARAPVSRDEASEAVGVARPTVAFHLDRLADEGLLDVDHQRLSGRTGPGAGRPSKLYLRAARQLEVSLPQRRYELAGELLAGAVEEAEVEGVPIREAVARRAREEGRQMAQADVSGELMPILDRNGFEPRNEDGVIRLGNCPFHNLAQKHPDLVCGMNLHLLQGLVEGLESRSCTATLAPSPGNCCVVLEVS
ncbi:MAG: helix-turn-helix domain-containing protein [Nocardioides sp.]|nr:helix-turn-helix domain-containing protein [Nocardioides sp.]